MVVIIIILELQLFLLLPPELATLLESPNTSANLGNKMGSAPLSPQYTFPCTLGQLLEAKGGIPINESKPLQVNYSHASI
jgi:hypothetical protein